MAEFIRSGEEHNVFNQKISLTDNEVDSLEKSEVHVLDWLQENQKEADRSLVIRTVVLPAILSDMLHCFYEALKASEKGKMAISYMLIRKPIQESLYVLEAMVLDEAQFTKDLSENPLKLRHKNGGDVAGQSKRISKVLDKLNLGNLLDAEYIAQLRFDKSSDDSFDGVCNHAMHLFTEHKAIKTSNLNINFIFAGASQKYTQWKFLYSRLPYLLYYIYCIFEHIAESVAPTTEEYLIDMQRRIIANYILSYSEIESDYQTEQMKLLVANLYAWLLSHYENKGITSLDRTDLETISTNGDLANRV